MTNHEQIESHLIFQGLIGIYDPRREETAVSVKLCHRAGILPHNLYHCSEDVVSMVMTANEFDALSDEEIDNLPVLPQHLFLNFKLATQMQGVSKILDDTFFTLLAHINNCD